MPGKKLRQAHQAEVERALGDFVDLPADGDGLHLGGEHDEKPRGLKQPVGGIGERDGAGVPGIPGGSHRIYFATKSESDESR